MKFRLFTLTAVLFSTASVLADHDHRISVNVDGTTYQCGGGGGDVTDPNCVKKVSDYCYSKTSFSSSDCFDKASAACRGAGTSFPACVSESTDYCYSHTSFSASQCFEKSLSSCKGNWGAMSELMDAVRKSSLRRP